MHRKMSTGGNGGGGVPDWFFWALALLGLTILALILMYGDRIVT